MKATIKNRWVEALRSGEYLQGTGQLYSAAADAYCCLGVLCALAEQDGVVTRETDDEATFWGGEEATLPAEVQKWAWLDSHDPHVDRRGGSYSLSYINDQGDPFTRIADLIEESL